MARKALIEKQMRLYNQKFNSNSTKNVKWTKYYNRCHICWRSRWYVRDFWICRVCLRKYAREWLIMWLRKASW